MDMLRNLYVGCLVYLSCTSMVLAGIINTNDRLTYGNLGEVGWVLGVAAVCAGLLLTVLVISLCGGCTPMEVGSDGHEAAGGRKSGTHGQYDGVATDANTRVLSAGTTLAHDPYQHEDQSLPYALHPQGVQTDNNFSGYQAHPQATGGYTGPSTGNQQRPGAHVSATASSEPPPPNYYEATGAARSGNQRPTAPPPAQSYGW